MSNFFKDVLNDLDSLGEDLLGPDYVYWKQIKPPEEIGMSSKGNLKTLADDVAGLIAYVELLVTGGGKASRVKGPLGDRFFLQTGAKCQDKKTGNKVTRSIFIDNIPEGNIPFISSGMGMNFSIFEGLIPGTISGLSNVNPLAIFQAFQSGTNPTCRAVTLPARDAHNVSSMETGFLTDTDIRNISPCLFKGHKNPVSNETRSGCNVSSGGHLEGFQGKQSTTNIKKYSNIISYIYITFLITLFLCVLSKTKKSKK